MYINKCQCIRIVPVTFYIFNYIISVCFSLSGDFPCKGSNDFEVLHKTKNSEWNFGEEFASFSEEAKDFISKLLVKNPR